MERTQFTFYDSFFQAISRIKSKTARCDAYDALCRYALYGEEPDIDKMPDAAAIAYVSFKPNLDASRRKAQNGSVGGRSKQTASKSEANGKQDEIKNKDKDKKKNKNKDKCHSEAFELFWQSYPRKEGRQKAEAAFAKVDAPIEDLLKAIEDHKKSAQWEKDGGQFIPHAATWLNGKRWLDQMVPATKVKSAVPKGASGVLGEAEMEAIRQLMGG